MKVYIFLFKTSLLNENILISQNKKITFKLQSQAHCSFASGNFILFYLYLFTKNTVANIMVAKIEFHNR